MLPWHTLYLELKILYTISDFVVTQNSLKIHLLKYFVSPIKCFWRRIFTHLSESAEQSCKIKQITFLLHKPLLKLNKEALLPIVSKC